LTIAADDLEAIQAVVDTYNAILTSASTNTAPTLDNNAYAKIGVTIPAGAVGLLNYAIAAAPSAGVDTVAKIQAIATAANRLTTLANAGTGAPTAADYTAVGITEVVVANAGAYNSGVEEKKASNATTIQSIVTNYNTVLASAGNANATAPTKQTYEELTVIVPIKAIGLLNSAVSGQTTQASNTIPKLKAMSTAADRIVTTAENSEDAGLTVGDFTVLGITGATSSNLTDAGDAVAAASVSDVQTVPAVQSLLSDVLLPALPVPFSSVWTLILLMLLFMVLAGQYFMQRNRKGA